MARWELVTMTREELYQKVWSTPMRTLAKEYGLSDVGLAKVCKKYNIPRPSLGYWAKVEHGKEVRQVPLPKAGPGEPQAIRMHRYYRSETVQDQQVEALAARESQPEPRIVVPAVLCDPHPLIERTLKSLNSAGADSAGYVRPRASQCLNVGVSRPAIDRAMRIMDALVKALEEQGHAVTVLDGETSRTTLVAVVGEQIAISLFSRQARRDHIPTAKEKQMADSGWGRSIRKYDYFASDQLEFRIVGGLGNGYWRSFGDSGKRRAENCLNSFIAGLLKAAETTKAVRLENERQGRIRQEEERRRKEATERRETEEKYLKWLLAEANAWASSQNIRAYLRAMRQAAAERFGSIHPESRLAHWLAWAEAQADRQDPLIQSPQSPMDYERPYGFYGQDKFQWPRVENGIFLDPANAKAPASEGQDGTTPAGCPDPQRPTPP